MKKIFNIILSVAAIASLSSCVYKTSFDTHTYVSFGTTGTEVSEDCGSIVVPIAVYNAKEATTVNVNIESTGKAGEDYEIVGNTTSFTLTPEKPSANLEIKIINHPGTYTGNFSITASIAKVTGAETGSFNEFYANILDKDIPVDWKFVEGVWNAMDYTLAGAQDGDAYKVTIAKVDDTHFTLTNLWGGSQTLKGTIEFDEATNTATLALDKQQVGYISGSYGPCWFLLLKGNSLYASPIPGTASAAGITIGSPEAGYYVYINSGTYAGYGLNDGNYTKLTR